MKTNPRTCQTRGLTFIEAVALAAVLFVGLVAVWPFFARRGCKAGAPRINCVLNIKRIGLAMRMWANDHGDKFPWQVSTETNGTLEFAESPAVFRHFLAISNELTSPKVLACTTDTQVSRERDWTKLNNSHVSYFVGLEANEVIPQTILSGDRNITGGVLGSNGIVRFGLTNQAGWGIDLHKSAGNIGLADGSAHQVTDNGLSKQIQAALGSLTNVTELRFAIPKPN